MPTLENQLLSVSEASKTLGIGRTKVYEEINAGRLKARKFGKRTLIPMQSIKAWTENLPSYEEA
jgi:excisionase family DNA binding protein